MWSTALCSGLHDLSEFCISLTLWVYGNFVDTAAINTHDASLAHWVKGNWYGWPSSIWCQVYMALFFYFGPKICWQFPILHQVVFLIHILIGVHLRDKKTILYLLRGEFNSSNPLQYYFWDSFLFLTNSYLNNSFISVWWYIADDPGKEQNHVS